MLRVINNTAKGFGGDRMKSKQVAFRVRPGRDDDIISWLNSLHQDEKGVFIRQALREWLDGKSKSVPYNVDQQADRNTDDDQIVDEQEIISKLDKLDKLDGDF